MRRYFKSAFILSIANTLLQYSLGQWSATFQTRCVLILHKVHLNFVLAGVLVQFIGLHACSSLATNLQQTYIRVYNDSMKQEKYMTSYQPSSHLPFGSSKRRYFLKTFPCLSHEVGLFDLLRVASAFYHIQPMIQMKPIQIKFATTSRYCAFLLVYHSSAWSINKVTALETLLSISKKILSPYMPCQTPRRYLICLPWPTYL